MACRRESGFSSRSLQRDRQIPRKIQSVVEDTVWAVTASTASASRPSTQGQHRLLRQFERSTSTKIPYSPPAPSHQRSGKVPIRFLRWRITARWHATVFRARPAIHMILGKQDSAKYTWPAAKHLRRGKAKTLNPG